MWKRDESVKPTTGHETAPPAVPAGVASAPASRGPEADVRRYAESHDVVNIGKSVVIKGELNGSEDLTVEGSVDGTIELKDHVLTIGPHGQIKAKIFAKSVIVLGKVTGDVNATEKVDIRDNGAVDGNIIAPRVAIAEGAHFRGSVDMQRKSEAARPADAPKAEAKPGSLAPNGPKP